MVFSFALKLAVDKMHMMDKYDGYGNMTVCYACC